MATKKPLKAAKPVKVVKKAAKPASKGTKPATKAAKAPSKTSSPARKAVSQAPAKKVSKVVPPKGKTVAPKKAVKATPPSKKVEVKKVSKPAVGKNAPAKASKPAPQKSKVTVKKAPIPEKKTTSKAAVPAKKAPVPVKKAAAPVVKSKAEPAKPAKKVVEAPKVAPKAPSVKATPSPKVEAPKVQAKAPVEKKPARPVVIPKTSTDRKVDYEPDFTKSVLDAPAPVPQGPTMRYSDQELGEFRELINKKLDAAKKELAYLQGLITRRDEMGGDETDNRYMTMEDGGMSMEREQLSQMASRQITFIDHLEKALMRIENKTYGICRVTGKLIDKARLRAVPHATLSMEAKLGITK